MTVDELIDLLSEMPGYYPVHLNATVPVTDVHVQGAGEAGPHVVVA